MLLIPKVSILSEQTKIISLFFSFSILHTNLILPYITSNTNKVTKKNIKSNIYNNIPKKTTILIVTLILILTSLILIKIL